VQSKKGDVLGELGVIEELFWMFIYYLKSCIVIFYYFISYLWFKGIFGSLLNLWIWEISNIIPIFNTILSAEFWCLYRLDVWMKDLFIELDV